MPDRGKHRIVTPEEWAAVREAHSKGESHLSISKRTGIHRNTIRNRREADAKRGQPWTVQPDVQLHSDEAAKAAAANAQAKVIDIATKRAIEHAEQSGVIDAIANTVASELAIQGRIAAKLAEAAEKTVDEYVRGDIHPSEKQNKADVLNALATAVAKAFDSAREINGIKSGVPSVPKDNDGQQVSEIRFTIVEPERTGTEG